MKVKDFIEILKKYDGELDIVLELPERETQWHYIYEEPTNYLIVNGVLIISGGNSQ